MPNTNPIEFEPCDTLEKLQRLRTFAATFDPPHVIHDSELRHRLVIARRGKRWIGYAIISHEPVVFSAWSSTETKPRDIWDAMKAFAGWARLQFGSGLTAVPLNTKKFPKKVMEKLGFFRLKTELYRTDEH